MPLSTKSLLILSPDYPDKDNKFQGCNFVKSLIEKIAPEFKEISIISPVLPTFGRTAQDKFCINYSYNNVNVYYPKCIYIPNLIPGQNRYWQLYFDFRHQAIKNTIKKYNIKFDLIHAQFNYIAGMSAYKLSQEYKKPYIVSIYEDSIWLRVLNYEWGSKYIDSIINANKIIGINQADTHYLMEYNRSSEYIPMGYNPRIFNVITSKNRCKELLDLDPNKRLIVSVGNIEDRKRFDLLPPVINYLKNNYSPDINCIIIGNDKGGLKSLKQRIELYKVKNEIKILGNIDNNKLALYLNAADILTSQSRSEGFGITQIESLACGTPVVASNTNGSNSILSNNHQFGERFDGYDITDFIEKLERNLNRSFDRDLISNRARQYSWDNVSLRILDKYREVLGEN